MKIKNNKEIQFNGDDLVKSVESFVGFCREDHNLVLQNSKQNQLIKEKNNMNIQLTRTYSIIIDNHENILTHEQIVDLYKKLGEMLNPMPAPAPTPSYPIYREKEFVKDTGSPWWPATVSQTWCDATAATAVNKMQ